MRATCLVILLLMSPVLYAQSPVVQSVSPSGVIQGLSFTVVIFGANLSGVTAVTFSGTGVTATIGSISSSQLQIVVNVDQAAAPGPRTLTVSGAGGSTTGNGVTVSSPGVIAPGFQSVDLGETTSSYSLLMPGRFADRFQFTLTQPQSVTLSMQSAVFDTYLYLLSPAGTILTSNDDFGGSWNSEIQASLPAGAYVVETTSATIDSEGDFVLGFSTGTVPIVQQMSPNDGMLGQTIPATIDGLNLAGVTAVTFSGTGVTAVIGSGGTPSTLPLTVSIAPDTTVNERTVTVTNSAGSTTTFFDVSSRGYITSMSQSAGSPGTTMTTSIAGEGIDGATAITLSGSGIRAAFSSFSAPYNVSLTIAADAAPGIRTVTVVTPEGVSIPFNGFTVAAPAPGPLSWKMAAPFADPRTASGVIQAAVSLIGNTIYASHGSRNGDSDLLSAYDLATNTWTHGGPSLPNAGIPRRSIGATALGKHFAIGGVNSNGNTANSAVEEFDPSTGTWTNRSPLPGSLEFFGVASLNDKIYVIGGLSGGVSINGLNQVYDPATDTWTALKPMPIPADANSATIGYNGKIYIFGGATVSVSATSAVQIYDTSSNTWTLGTAMPTPRYDAGGGIVNGQIVVYGGYGSDEQPQPVTEVYNPATDSWTLGPALPANLTESTFSQGPLFNNSKMFALADVPGNYSYLYFLDASTPPQPMITAISPVLGLRGTTVQATITGTNLSDATSLTFIPTSSGLTATINSGGTSTSLPVAIVIPISAATGTVTFAVNTSSGSAIFSGISLTVSTTASNAVPVVSGVSIGGVSLGTPPWPVTQGLQTSLVFAGTSLDTASAVSLNGIGVNASSLSVQSSTSLSALITVAPFAPLGNRSVVVTSQSGMSSQPFTAIAVRAPASINPGQTLTKTINFGNARSTFASRGAAERYQFTIGGAPVDVTIELSTTQFNPYIYLISPDGSYILGTSGIDPVTEYRDSLIRETLSAGTYTIEITTDSSVQIGINTSYTYLVGVTALPQGTPVVTGVTPASGPQGATMPATLSGVNLAGATAVTFDGTGVTATVTGIGTSTSLPISIAIGASAAPGVRNVIVVTPSGASSLFLGFTVAGPQGPTLAEMYPAASAPGNTVAAALRGTNLSGITGVQFSGSGVTATIAAGQEFDVLVPLTVTIAADAAYGPRSVTVTTSSGTVTLPNMFTVVPRSNLGLSWKLKSWNWDPRGSSPIVAGAANVIGGKIYLSNGSRITETSASVWFSIYDIASGTWTYGGPSAPDAPAVESYVGGATAFGRDYVIAAVPAGYANNYTPSLDVQIFDPATSLWTIGTPWTFEGYGLAAASLNNKIYAFGGSTAVTPNQGLPLGVSMVYDPAADQWTKRSPMPMPVTDNAATIAFNGKIYVFGGFTGSGATNVLQIYDPPTDTWTTGSPMPTPREDAMAGIIDNQIVVFGGYDPLFGGFAITEIYEPSSDSWTLGPDMIAIGSAFAQGVTYDDSHVYAVAGSISGQTEAMIQTLDTTASSQPAIRAINPVSGLQGATFDATVSGTNLAGATAVTFETTGVTATVEPGGSSTSIPVTLTIANNAPPVANRFFVSSPSGPSLFSGGFNVFSSALPIVTALSPPAVLRGIGLPATISGSNLAGVTSVTVSGTGMTATVTDNSRINTVAIALLIDADAALGPRTLTLATPAGLSNPFGFAVTTIPPQISDTGVNPPGLTPAVAPYYGGPFTLTLNGQYFQPGASVSIGPTALSTTFVNTTQLTAQVTTAALTAFGANAVTVANPDGGLSNSQSLKIGAHGDLNANGSVNIGDALIAALTVGGLTGPPLVAAAGDINLSSVVNIGDALTLALISGRLIQDWAVPQISSLAPSIAVAGSPLTLNATGLSPNATDHEILFTTAGGTMTRVIPSSVTNNTVTVQVPDNAVGGWVQIYRKDTPLGGREFPLLVSGTSAPLHLSGITPNSGVTSGAAITLFGTGFDPIAANNSVIFSSGTGPLSVTPSSSSGTTLTVSAPAGVTCGPVAVHVGGATGNSRIFAPAGSSCSLQLVDFWGGAAPGDTLVIEGAGFDVGTPANNIVTFPAAGGGSVIAPVLASSGTQLHIHVPEVAVTGTVTVTVGNTTSNGINYRPQ